jgi:hypothetical protein
MTGQDQTDSSDNIHIVDYERVRDEIDNRTKLSSQLLNYDLIVIGAVIASYDKIPHEVTIVGAWLSSILWLMWLDHTTAIYKLAAYLEVVLTRRLRQYHANVLGWEYFLRELDAGGNRASQILYGRPLSEALKIPKTAAITN